MLKSESYRIRANPDVAAGDISPAMAGVDAGAAMAVATTDFFNTAISAVDATTAFIATATFAVDAITAFIPNASYAVKF